jgi:uncharacterized protein YccT (UPF0319 family)
MTTRLLTAAVLLMIGCSTHKEIDFYSGDPRPDDEVGTVILPLSLEIESVDGRRVPRSSSLLRSGEIRLKLLPGDHALEVYYEEYWDFGDGSEEDIKSSSVVLNLTVEAGTRTMLAHRKPSNIADARVLANKLEVWAVPVESGDPTGPHAPATPTATPPSGREQLDSSAAPAEASEPDTAALASGVASVVSSSADAQAAPGEDHAAMDQLKLWWERATPVEREAFRSWIER